jgi:hypothetical protein
MAHKDMLTGARCYEERGSAWTGCRRVERKVCLWVTAGLAAGYKSRVVVGVAGRS